METLLDYFGKQRPFGQQMFSMLMLASYLSRHKHRALDKRMLSQVDFCLIQRYSPSKLFTSNELGEPQILDHPTIICMNYKEEEEEEEEPFKRWWLNHDPNSGNIPESIPAGFIFLFF